MAIDFGQAIAGIGQHWAQALSEQEKVKMEKEKLAFSQMMQQGDQTRQNKYLDLAQDQQAQSEAKALFDQTLSLVKEGPSRPLNQQQFEGLDPRLGSAFFKELPQPRATPTALGMDGKPVAGTESLPAVAGEGKFYGFEPGESERARIAASNESGRASRAQAGLYQRELDRGSREGIAAAGREASMDRTEFLEGGRNSRFGQQPITIDLGGFVIAPTREQLQSGDTTGATQFNKTLTPTQTAVMGEKVGQLKDYAGRINEALKIGRETNWAGTGIVEGRVKGTLGGYFAKSEDFRLRALIGDLFAENAHARFGGALTAQEIDRAKFYLSEATDDPRKIESNLMLMLDVITPKLERGQERIQQMGAPIGGGQGGGQAAPSGSAPATGSSGYQRYLSKQGK